jgi:hypothetical protein
MNIMRVLKTSQLLMLILTASISTFSSCRKKDDVRPEITLESPVINQTFVRGREIEVKATFTDNKELSEYKIDIHDNFDSHSHDKTQSVPWAEIIIGELSGKKEEINFKVKIPENTETGPYHFDIKCLDAAGNESRYISRDIIIISEE